MDGDKMDGSDLYELFANQAEHADIARQDLASLTAGIAELRADGCDIDMSHAEIAEAIKAHAIEFALSDLDAREKVRVLLTRVMDKGDVNACRVWRGFGDLGERPYGWWVARFGEPATYWGKSAAEVEERIKEHVAELREIG